MRAVMDAQLGLDITRPTQPSSATIFHSRTSARHIRTFVSLWGAYTPVEVAARSRAVEASIAAVSARLSMRAQDAV